MPRVKLWEVKAFVEIEAETPEEAVEKVQLAIQVVDNQNLEEWADIQRVTIGTHHEEQPTELRRNDD